MMRELYSMNGSSIPQIGFGTYLLKGSLMESSLKNAICSGYRLIDTSDDYDGERSIGDALDSMYKDCICTREELFLQTKISNNDSLADEPLRGIYFCHNSPFMKRHSVDEIVREKVQTSLRLLHTEYLDSVLIHFPYEDYYLDIWKVLADLRKEGLIRFIGVSNFHPRHIEAIRSCFGELPFANEIYMSPIGTKDYQIEYARENDMLLMTYSPLMDVIKGRVNSAVIDDLSHKYSKSVTQIILRWNLQSGSIPLPKSSKAARIQENINIFDFELTAEEMDRIDSLNKNYQYLPESLNCPGL